jgi:hypothetical protein
VVAAGAATRRDNVHALVPADKVEHERRGQDQAVSPQHDPGKRALPHPFMQSVRAMVRNDQPCAGPDGRLTQILKSQRPSKFST